MMIASSSHALCRGDGVASECVPGITQTKQSSWTDGFGVKHSVWNVFVAAPSDQGIRSLTLFVPNDGDLIENVWELAQNTEGVPMFTLPAWRLQNGGIPQGQSHAFGYIVKSAEALTFQVSQARCVDL
jgi:hypothetical protein